MEFQNILVPIDFSQYCSRALEYAVSIAEKYQGKMVFLHVIEQENYFSSSAEGVKSVFEIDQNLKDMVLENLKEFVAFQVEEIMVNEFVVKEGSAPQQIIEFVKNEKIDLLVMSSHGLAGAEYLSMGRTAAKVMRGANCPVLTVKGAPKN